MSVSIAGAAGGGSSEGVQSMMPWYAPWVSM